MSEHNVSSEFVERFKQYLSSKEYGSVSDYSKSEYWEHHSKVIGIDIIGNKVIMKGDSGFYVPSKKNIMEYIRKVIRSPSLLILFIKRKLGIPKPRIKLMGYFEAFDNVMKHDLIADPILSPYRINFKELKKKEGIIGSVSEMQEDFPTWSRYRLNPHIVSSYYFYNILHGFIDLTQVKTVLEIGAGNGNLAALLHKRINQGTIVIVDLPETICLSMVFLTELFPEAKILIPHEKALGHFNDYDFVFLTPEQIDVIKDDSIDLAINSNSFQEMTHKQIEEYFQLIQRCCKNDGHFFTSNRVEKISCGPDFQKETLEPPQRFSDYPWVRSNKVCVNEICRFMRLVQLDNIFIRLEQIKKSNMEDNLKKKRFNKHDLPTK